MAEPVRARLTLAAALLLVGCSTASSVTVTEMAAGTQLPTRTPKYDAAFTAIQQAAFEDLARRPDVTAEERALARALADVERGRFREAEGPLARLAGAKSERVRDAAKTAHGWILVHEGRWSDLVRLHGDEDASLLRLARGWATAPPERVTFTAPSATLPASLEDVDVPFVDVCVGEKTFKFILDTGATVTLISAAAAEALGIQSLGEAANLGTSTTRELSAAPAVIPRLVLGNAVFENHPCVIAGKDDLKFKFLLFSLFHVDGVLGCNAIRKLDVEVDYRVPQVTIRQPQRRAVERNLFWLGAPVVRARLADGMPILAGLDTGASTSDLRPPFFEILPGEYREEVAGKQSETSRRVWGAAGSERLTLQRVEKLKVLLGRHVLDFRNIESGQGNMPAVFAPVLQFGSDIAIQRTLRIDFTNGALELGPSGR